MMNLWVKEGGFKPTGLANARSWLKWGVKLEEPREGCIVVLKRPPSPTSGHVAFYVRELHDMVLLLGGNQGNQVRESWYHKSDVLGYRWPEGVK